MPRHGMPNLQLETEHVLSIGEIGLGMYMSFHDAESLVMAINCRETKEVRKVVRI